MRKGIAELVQLVPQQLAYLPDAMRLAIELQMQQLLEADRRIVELDKEIKRRVRTTRQPAGWQTFRASGRSPPRRLLRRSEIERKPSVGPRLCRLGGANPADRRHRRQGDAGTDRQARRCLSAPPAHPRRPGDLTTTRQAREALRMGAQNRRPSSSMSPPRRSPTRWRVSPGRCWRGRRCTSLPVIYPSRLDHPKGKRAMEDEQMNLQR